MFRGGACASRMVDSERERELVRVTSGNPLATDWPTLARPLTVATTTATGTGTVTRTGTRTGTKTGTRTGESEAEVVR